MSNEDFETFRQIVLGDDSLQEQLRDLTDREEFIERVIQEGSTRNCIFTRDDVEEAMRDNHRLWLHA